MPRTNPGSSTQPDKPQLSARRAILPALAAVSLASVCALPLIAAQTQRPAQPNSKLSRRGAPPVVTPRPSPGGDPSSVPTPVNPAPPVVTPRPAPGGPGAGPNATPGGGTGSGGTSGGNAVGGTGSSGSVGGVTTGGGGAAAPVKPPLIVSTYRYDNARSGVNYNETILTPANVKPGTFGKLFTVVTDGLIYGQPLYYQGLNLTNVYTGTRSTHDTIFVATNNNTVYAFDADTNTGNSSGPLWRINFNELGNNGTPVNGNDITTVFGFPQADVQPLIGIVGTPVLDATSKTLYIVARTTEGQNYVHRIHAIDITTGQEKFNSPQLVGQYVDQNGDIQPVTVPGNGDNFDGNGNVYFDLLFQNQRPALTLVNGILYIAYGAFDNSPPYHGWVFGYDTNGLDSNNKIPLQGIFCTSPNANNTFIVGDPVTTGGIDMSGSGLAADASGLYFSTGDGIFNANGIDPFTGAQGTEYGESVVKIGFAPNTGQTQYPVLSYFAPFNHDFLANNDIDLGNGGVALLPDNIISGHPHAMVIAGREGKVYLLDRDNLGGVTDLDAGVIGTFPNFVGPVYGVPAVYTSLDPNTSLPVTNIFYHGVGDVIRGFVVNSGAPNLASNGFAGTSTFDFPGAMPVISSNKGTNGVVWELEGVQSPNADPNLGLENIPRYGILHAYDTATLTELLNSNQKGGGINNVGDYVKFTQPMVANGRVYVTGGSPTQFDPGGSSVLPQGRVTVFGLTSSQPGTVGQGLHYQLSGAVGFAATSEDMFPPYPLQNAVWPLPEGGLYLIPNAPIVNAGRRNYYSVTALDANNVPQKISTTCKVFLVDQQNGRSYPQPSVTFNNQSNVVFPMTITAPFSIYLIKVQDANGNTSQSNPRFPPTAPAGQNDLPLIIPNPAFSPGFDHFNIRIPAAARDGQLTNISIQAAASNNVPIAYATTVIIYDTLPAGAQDFSLPTDTSPTDGFGIPNDLIHEPLMTPHSLAGTQTVNYAYEFQYGIADYALTPGVNVGIDDNNLNSAFSPYGPMGTDFPNAQGTGTYPVIFNGVGTHVIIVQDGATGICTTGTINVVAAPGVSAGSSGGTGTLP